MYFSSLAIITIIIRVIRINELNPIGTISTFIFNIFENSPVDTLVGKITFTDADWPFNNVKYTIVGGNLGSPPKFYIEPDTGTVKLMISIDNKIMSLHTYLEFILLRNYNYRNLLENNFPLNYVMLTLVCQLYPSLLIYCRKSTAALCFARWSFRKPMHTYFCQILVRKIV